MKNTGLNLSDAARLILENCSPFGSSELKVPDEVLEYLRRRNMSLDTVVRVVLVD